MRRRIIAVAAGMLALVTFATPGVASAHAILDSSDPSASAVVSQSPSEITLDFNEQIEGTLLSIRLFDASQDELSIGHAGLSPSDSSVVTASMPRLKVGVYVVVWRVVSADGHPVSGAFPFEVGDQSSGKSEELLTKILTSINTKSPLGNPLAAGRFISFLSLVMLIGIVVFTWGSSLVNTVKARQTMRLSALGIALGSVVVLLLQGPYASGRGWGAIFDTQLIGDVMATRLGLAVLLRLILVVAWAMLSLTDVRAASGWWKNIAFLTAVGTIATFAMSGHPSAGSATFFYMLVDSMHVGAVSAWVGGLIALVILRHDHAVDAARFSRIATWSMPIAVVTGVVQGLHLLGGLGGITGSSYGKLLILKTALVLVVIALGTKARTHLTDTDGRQFAKSIRFEAALMVVVLAVTALLVGTSPNDKGLSIPHTFSSTQIRSNVVADISVAPTKVGTVEVHVILTPPGGALKPVTNVLVQMSLPSRKIPAIPVSMIEIGPNHWTGVLNIPYSGNWSFEARVTPTPNETLLYTATFEVGN